MKNAHFKVTWTFDEPAFSVVIPVTVEYSKFDYSEASQTAMKNSVDTLKQVTGMEHPAPVNVGIHLVSVG